VPQPPRAPQKSKPYFLLLLAITVPLKVPEIGSIPEHRGEYRKLAAYLNIVESLICCQRYNKLIRIQGDTTIDC
jgi:hypothetical protein